MNDKMDFRIGQDVWVQGGSKKGDEDAAKVIEIDTANGEIVVSWSVRGDTSVVPIASVRSMYDEVDTAGESSRRSQRVSTKPDRLDGAFKNEKYRKMPMNKLKAICKEHNLRKSGDKGTLIFQIIKKEEEETTMQSKTAKSKKKKGKSNQSKKMTPPVKKRNSTNKRLGKQTGPFIGLTASSTDEKKSDCRTVGLEIRRRRNTIESYFRSMKKISDDTISEDANSASSRSIFQSPEYSSEVYDDDDKTVPYPNSIVENINDDDDDRTVPYPSNVEFISTGIKNLVRENEKIAMMIRDVKSSDHSSETNHKMLAIMESQNSISTKLLTMLHDNASGALL